MTIEDGYADLARMGQAEDRRGPRWAGPQDRPDLARACSSRARSTEPDYGTLLDDMFFEQGSDIPFARFIAPRHRGRARPSSSSQAAEAGKVDTRATCWRPPTTCSPRSRSSTRASSSSTATPRRRARSSTPSPTTRPMPASWSAGKPVKPDAVDLRWVSACLHKNGVIEERAWPPAVLDHPATGVASAREQAGALGRRPGGRRGRARRLVPFRVPTTAPARRHLPCRPCPAGRAVSIRLSSDLFGIPHAHPHQPVQEGHGREARPDLAWCARSAWPTTGAAEILAGTATTGCWSTADARPAQRRALECSRSWRASRQRLVGAARGRDPAATDRARTRGRHHAAQGSASTSARRRCWCRWSTPPQSARAHGAGHALSARGHPRHGQRARAGLALAGLSELPARGQCP